MSHGDLHIHICPFCYRNWDCADLHCELPRSSQCGGCDDDPEVQPGRIENPVPDELCPHVELGEEMVGGFVFDAENPKVSVGMCALCLAICQAEFITAQPFALYQREKDEQ